MVGGIYRYAAFAAVVLFSSVQSMAEDTELTSDPIRLTRADRGVYVFHYGPTIKNLVATPIDDSKRGRDPKCESLQRQVRADGVISVSVFGGYADRDDGTTVDEAMTEALGDLLTAPCDNSDFHACGFSRTDIGVYQKIIRSRGSGSNVSMIVRTYASSETSIDALNLNSSDQRDRTYRVESAFRLALHADDIVLYDGHSRSGGGPDFAPPKRIGSEGVDYGWYRRNKPGLRLLTDELSRGGGPRVLGLFSCLSSSHFLSALSPYLRGSLLVGTSSLVPDEGSFLGTLFTIDMFAGEKCGSELSDRARAAGALNLRYL